VEITKSDEYRNLYKAYTKGGYITKSLLTLYAAYENDENLRIKDLAEIVYEKKYKKIKECQKDNLLNALKNFEILRFVKFRENKENMVAIKESPTKKLIFDKYFDLIKESGCSAEELFNHSEILKPIICNYG
jgi:hypothetical protein